MILWPYRPNESTVALMELLYELHSGQDKILTYYGQIKDEDEQGIIELLRSHPGAVAYLYSTTHVAAAVSAGIPCFWVETNLKGNVTAIKQFRMNGKTPSIRQIWPDNEIHTWQPQHATH
jgi:hypothetical protein